MASNNVNGSCSSSSTSGSEPVKKLNVNAYNFQVRMRKVLTTEEIREVTHILSCYHKNRNVYYLAHSLKTVLDTEEKRTIIPLLKQILPMADRAGFDQFTCEGVYIRRSGSSRESSVSLQQTDDSGIGITSCGNTQDRKFQPNEDNRPVRSASMSEISRKSNKLFSSGTFGSAVRRRVKAVLARKASTSSLKSSDRRRHYSETQLNEVGKEESSKFGSFMKKSSFRKKKVPTPDVTRKSDVVQIKLHRPKSGKSGLGFIIGGGAEFGTGFFISRVEQGSTADEANIKAGDLIVRVNGTSLHSAISHDVAVQIMKKSDKLILYIKPQAAKHLLPRRGKQPPVARPPSPPVNGHSKLDHSKSGLRLLSAGQRRINLCVKEGQNLGLMIRGGAEYGLGVFVTGVDDGSAAENAGLKAGDEILEVNNSSLAGMTHADAVQLIRSSRMLIMTVQYVGKVPHSVNMSQNRAIDDRVSLHSSIGGGKVVGKIQPNGVRGAFQRKMTSPTKQMILPNKRSVNGDGKIPMKLAALNNSLSSNSVWRTLSEEEQRSLKYYVKEYLSGHVSPDALVLALSELLPDHEKFSLMSVVRDYITQRDLDRFDVLVLRREVEALRHRHQGESPNGVNGVSPKTVTQEKVTVEKITPESSNGLVDLTDRLKEDNPVIEPPKLQSTPNTSFQTPPSVETTALISPVHSPNHQPRIPPVPPKAPPPNKPRRSSFRARKAFDTTSSFGFEEPKSRRITPRSNTAPREETKLSSISKDETQLYTTPKHSLKSNKSTQGSLKSHTQPKSTVNASINGHQSSIPPKTDPAFTSPVKTDPKDRSISPFSLALEKHRSSHSGRIKAGNKTPTHPALPSPLFFTPPNHKPKEDVNHGVTNDDFPPPPLSFSSSASSTMSDASPHPPKITDSPSTITLRPTSFISPPTKTPSVPHQFNVTAEVHQTSLSKPAVKKVEKNKHNSLKPSQIDLNDNLSSDEENDSKFPFFFPNVDKQKVVIFRRSNALGLTIAGGAGTQQPLPLVAKIQPGSCSQLCGRIKVGHVIHEVNGTSLRKLTHNEAVRLIAHAFKEEGRDWLELLVSGPYLPM